jgi:NAD(P)H dehydrogenase (quinone)
VGSDKRNLCNGGTEGQMRNISIIYFSESGNTEKVANWIAEGATGVANTQIRLFNLKDTEDPDREYIESSDAVIFGTPTYVANMCWQMKKWFDT